MANKDLENYKKKVKQRLADLMPVFANAAVGDFSSFVDILEDTDDFAGLYAGIGILLEVVRKRMEEVQQARQEQEEVIKSARKNESDLAQAVQELEESRRAMLNVLEDLQVERDKLEEEKATDAAILASVGDGLFVTDDNGEILLVNKAFESLLGFNSDEAMGKDISEVAIMEDEEGKAVPKNKRPTLALLASSKNKKGEPVHLKGFYYVRKDKSRFPVAITVSTIVNSKLVGSVTVFRDISEELRLDRAKSELISIASHQLRTPLSALSWLIESLTDSFKDEKISEKQREYLRDIGISIGRMVALMEDLLNVSRIQLETVQIEKKPVDVAEFIKKFITDNNDYAQANKHTLVFENQNSKQKLPLVSLDPKILYNILQNLVSNAIEYSPKETTVTLSLKNEDGQVKFFVTNEGSLIAEEDREHIFGKFYRGENARKVKANGTGLGLFIVKSFVEKMGGKVGFVSEKNKGTTFWFTLPVFI